MARPRKKPTSSAAGRSVEAVRHKDKRKNIPTEELRDFVREDEQQPRKVLYPRDPDLDPQLVWKGKDEQDAAPLEVPAVPVYIQEKIHPQAIVDEWIVDSGLRHPPSTDTPSLFADFNGLPADFADRVDFYHHEGNWSNRLILGDSLLVMTSLAEKEALKGQVQMIYIDPPYGIKFGSNWQVSTRKRDVRDGKAEDVVRQPEQVKAFRDTWQLGIHSYLAYLRDRLVVARDLLTESGSIFVQIGDENVHLVRCLLDEVFGTENLIAHITFAKTSGSTREFLGGTCDFLLFYAKNRERLKFRQLFQQKTPESEAGGPYSLVELPDGSRRRMTSEEQLNPRSLAAGARVYRIDNLQSQSIGRLKGEGAACWFPVVVGGESYEPGARSRWKTNEQGMANLKLAGRLETTNGGLYYVRFIDDFAATPIADNWTDTVVAGFSSDKKYVVETSSKVVERCMLMTTDPGDLVLDPTCGSGTTAYVAEQWGRRWITIDTSRVALTLARTRLMAARFPYYYLADDHPQIAQMNTEEEIKYHLRKSVKSVDSSSGDVRKGFIYRRVPHITLKSIANNEEIDAIHARWQEQLEPLRAKINEAAGRQWQEWEIPRAVDGGVDSDKWMVDGKAIHYPPSTSALLHQWWSLRRARQKEIDASIQRRAEYEVLYDQPYEDTRRVRVTGPFTVESLSPHRTISVQEKRDRAERPRDWGAGGAAPPRTLKVVGPDDFGRMILENLRTAGVQTGRKGERLKFETLEPYAGQWIQGVGTYTEKSDAGQQPADGGGANKGEPSAGPSTIHSSPVTRRAAVCIGPEHGTVGPELVKEAAKEAVQGVGFDVLIVCGFAFDPHVSEEAKRYGKLVVLPCRMNPDLAMGDLLKKTGSGNLFMVFGEPDVVVDSDEWIVDKNKRRVMRYERFARLSGFGSLEEVNRAGEAGLSALRKLAEAGDVRSGVADTAGGGLDRGQHRRRRGAERDGGVRPIPRDRAGLGRGAGDVAGVDERTGTSAGGIHAAASGGADGCSQDALSPDEIVAIKNLTPASLPLSTIHLSQVTIRGLDVYDPTTGEIRSSSTDDIACWFIDTNYNGESFFVRHAYFTGADQPYDKLKRALRAEVDEAAWSALYSTVSRPFEKPATGRIAIKVINHYGDEVLKVYEVAT